MTPEEEYILKILVYDPETGILRWSRNHVLRGGQVAGSVDPNTGYLRVEILGRRYMVHRVCWFIFYKTWPILDLDHNPDQTRTNNRISNLREATKSENSLNRKGAQKNSKSGVIGVSFDGHSGYWRAVFKRTCLGRTYCFGKAIKMRKNYSKKYAEVSRIAKIV